MKKMLAAATGLRCLTAQGTHALSYEQKVLQIGRMISASARQTRQAASASQAGSAAARECGEGCAPGAINPAEALNEAKVGVAAKFVSIKPGEFEMGSPENEADRGDDEIQHRVALTAGYEIQATAVTQLQYLLVMGRSPAYFRWEENCDSGNFRAVYGLSLCAHHPVEAVRWDDAQTFIERLNAAQSRTYVPASDGSGGKCGPGRRLAFPLLVWIQRDGRIESARLA